MSTTTGSPFNFILPAVNDPVDADLWGGYLNTNFTNLSSFLQTYVANVNVADFILTAPVLKDYAETLQTVTITAGAATVNLPQGNHAKIVLDQNLTSLSITNPPASGKRGFLSVQFTQNGTGGYSVTFPSSIKWAGGTSPTVTTTANRTDIFFFTTGDGGTTWAGSVYGQNFNGFV